MRFSRLKIISFYMHGPIDEHNKFVMTGESDLLIAMITVQFKIVQYILSWSPWAKILVSFPRPHPQSTVHVGVVYQQGKDFGG